MKKKATKKVSKKASKKKVAKKTTPKKPTAPKKKVWPKVFIKSSDDKMFQMLLEKHLIETVARYPLSFGNVYEVCTSAKNIEEILMESSLVWEFSTYTPKLMMSDATENLQFEKLKNHIGHNLTVADYGNGAELSVECEDCHEVLYSETPTIDEEV